MSFQNLYFQIQTSETPLFQTLFVTSAPSQLLCQFFLDKIFPEVNFANILWATFVPIFFCQNRTNLKCTYKKAAWKSVAYNVGEIDRRRQTNWLRRGIRRLRTIKEQFWKERKSSSLRFVFLLSSSFNFTNIFWAQLRHFLCANKKFNLYFKHKKSFAQNFCTKKLRVKCWWNWPLLAQFE